MSGRSGAESAGVHRFIYLSDIAGSSRLAEVYPNEYRVRLAQHNALIEEQVAAHGGSIYKNTGDGYFALFESASGLVECARKLALGFAQFEPLSPDEPFRVRIALHAGELRQAGAEWFGPPLNRVSRICQVLSGGQVVLSGAVAAGLGGRPPEGVRFEDLGEHHLRDLAEPEHLYQLDHSGFALHEFPPLATLNNRPNNLLRQPNRFIGRTRELEELAGLLAGEQSLVTIIAPGGYGKSRLAAQLCANLLPQFERGCFMVYLAPVREGLDVPFALATALGYQFTAGRTPEQQLCDYLRNKELLLCLDNMEHLLERAALVADILKAAPKLKIIVTSREPLRIPGEHIYRLEPLAVHTAESQGYSEAVRLFTDRANLVSTGFRVDSGNLQLVEHICERLAGIPLAIELAAAWMDGFTLAELHDELSQQIDIEARSSLVEARHQSLKACLDWSWNLLGVEQQEMLMRLSVFRGGFFADAAGSVLNMKGMGLRSALLKLCDKSWLYTREVDGQTRFYLRDMLAHEYAFAKLEGSRQKDSSGGGGPSESEGRQAAATTGEDSLYESAVCAHAAYFAALAEREGPRLRGGGTPDGGAAQMQALRTWRLELANIEESLDTAMRRGSIDWLLPIATHLQRCYSLGSAFFTQRERYTQLLATAETLGDGSLNLQARIGLGSAYVRLGQYGEALALLQRSQADAQECGDWSAEAAAAANLAHVHYAQGNYSKAAELLSKVLALRMEIGDRQGEANALGNLGNVHSAQGDYGMAAELHGRAQAICSEIGDRHGEASAIGSFGNVHHALGDYARAAELQNQALAIRREIGDRQGEGHSLLLLAVVHRLEGDFPRAAGLYNQVLALCQEVGDRRGEAYAVGNLGAVHHAQGNCSHAEEQYSQALALFREIGDQQGEALFLCNLALVVSAQGSFALGAEMQDRALAIAREIGDRACEAHSLSNLALIHHGMGDNVSAINLQAQALVIFREIGQKRGIRTGCFIAAAALAALGKLRQAALALYGGQAQAAAISLHFDSDDQKLIDAARARLDAAVANGESTAEQLAAWKAEGEAMTLEELAEFMQNALADVAQSEGESGVEVTA